MASDSDQENELGTHTSAIALLASLDRFLPPALLSLPARVMAASAPQAAASSSNTPVRGQQKQSATGQQVRSETAGTDEQTG